MLPDLNHERLVEVGTYQEVYKSVEEITQNAPIARLLELCTEWKGRSEKEDEEYKLWLPNFLEKVAQERGGYYAPTLCLP